jgi:hypothetical protein
MRNLVICNFLKILRGWNQEKDMGGRKWQKSKIYKFYRKIWKQEALEFFELLPAKCSRYPLLLLLTYVSIFETEN